ncbi:MAG: hypothetical protein AAFV98_04995 [Chloroflexota bacterium]
MSIIEKHYEYIWTTNLKEFILVSTGSQTNGYSYSIIRLKREEGLVHSLIIEHEDNRQMVIRKLLDAGVRIMSLNEFKQLREDRKLL